MTAISRSAALALVAAPIAALAGCASTGGGEKAAISGAAPKATAAPAFRRADLMGRDAGALDALLGAPALVRREGQGEFRRYGLAGCALIVILYPDQTGRVGAAHLDSAAVRSGEAKPDLDACLAKGLAAG